MIINGSLISVAILAQGIIFFGCCADSNWHLAWLMFSILGFSSSRVKGAKAQWRSGSGSATANSGGSCRGAPRPPSRSIPVKIGPNTLVTLTYTLLRYQNDLMSQRVPIMHWPIHPKLCGILDQPFEVHIVKKERDVPAGTKSRGFSLIREHAEGCSKAILSETETPKVGLHDTGFFFHCSCEGFFVFRFCPVVLAPGGQWIQRPLGNNPRGPRCLFHCTKDPTPS